MTRNGAQRFAYVDPGSAAPSGPSEWRDPVVAVHRAIFEAGWEVAANPAEATASIVVETDGRRLWVEPYLMIPLADWAEAGSGKRTRTFGGPAPDPTELSALREKASVAQSKLTAQVVAWLEGQAPPHRPRPEAVEDLTSWLDRRLLSHPLVEKLVADLAHATARGDLLELAQVELLARYDQLRADHLALVASLKAPSGPDESSRWRAKAIKVLGPLLANAVVSASASYYGALGARPPSIELPRPESTPVEVNIELEMERFLEGLTERCEAVEKPGIDGEP